VISSGGCRCYSGPCSSSLALVWVLEVVKVFRVFGGCVSGCGELFPFDLFVVYLCMPCLLSYILCAGFRWAGSFGFEIGSRGLAAISI
jgi:hypothetical protein